MTNIGIHGASQLPMIMALHFECCETCTIRWAITIHGALDQSLSVHKAQKNCHCDASSLCGHVEFLLHLLGLYDCLSTIGFSPYIIFQS